jgi:hypothetical protein
MKIRKMAKTADTLYNTKENHFIYKEIPQIEEYFEELVRFFVSKPEY